MDGKANSEGEHFTMILFSRKSLLVAISVADFIISLAGSSWDDRHVFQPWHTNNLCSSWTQELSNFRSCITDWSVVTSCQSIYQRFEILLHNGKQLLAKKPKMCNDRDFLYSQKNHHISLRISHIWNLLFCTYLCKGQWSLHLNLFHYLQE